MNGVFGLKEVIAQVRHADLPGAVRMTLVTFPAQWHDLSFPVLRSLASSHAFTPSESPNSPDCHKTVIV